MPYEKELKLLCETLKRCRVPSHVTSPLAPISDVMDFTVLDMVRQDFSKKPFPAGYFKYQCCRNISYDSRYPFCC